MTTEETQPSTSFCWGTMNPITTADSDMTIDDYSVAPVDTRDGPLNVQAPNSRFGVVDAYDNFETSNCTVLAPPGVLIFDPSETFGTPYGTKALLNSPGAYYWRPAILNDQKVLLLDTGPTGATGPSTVNPLAYTKYVDGSAIGVVSPNGAAVVGATGGPYPSLTAAFAGVGVSTSAADAETWMVFVLSAPEGNSYTESPTTPAFHTVALRAMTVGGFITIHGSVTIDSTAGGEAVAGSAQGFSLDGVGIIGNLTVNADGTVPFIFIELFNSAYVEGNISGGTYVQFVLLEYASISGTGNCDVPSASVTAIGIVAITGTLTCASLYVSGTVALRGLSCTGRASVYGYQNPPSEYGPIAGSVSVNSTGNVFLGQQFSGVTYVNNDASGGTAFTACQFTTTSFNDANLSFAKCTWSGTPGSFTNTAGYAIAFDGPSLASYYDAGGSFTWPSNVVVLCQGGYRQGPIAARSTIGAGGATISLNGGSASSGFAAGGNFYTIPTSVTLLGNEVITVEPNGANDGDTMHILNQGYLGAFTYTVKDQSGNTLATFAGSGTPRGVDLLYNGTAFEYLGG